MGPNKIHEPYILELQQQSQTLGKLHHKGAILLLVYTQQNS